MSDDRLTKEELTEIFGIMLPMAAMELIFNTPDGLTIGEVRRKLREIAAKERNKDPWQALVERYADGRPLCNCRDAYYSTGGKYSLGGVEHNDGLYCKGGCNAAWYEARQHVARSVIAELKEAGVW